MRYEERMVVKGTCGWWQDEDAMMAMIHKGGRKKAKIRRCGGVGARTTSQVIHGARFTLKVSTRWSSSVVGRAGGVSSAATSQSRDLRYRTAGEEEDVAPCPAGVLLAQRRQVYLAPTLHAHRSGPTQPTALFESCRTLN